MNDTFDDTVSENASVEERTSEHDSAEDTTPRDDAVDSSLLSVEGLTKHYPITEGWLQREVGRIRAVDGIDFEVRRGETLGLIGESGCGKSTAAMSLLRIEDPTDGTVRFDGDDVTEYTDTQLRAFRRRAALVFQDPNGSFDPRQPVGKSVAEPLRIHGMADQGDRREVTTYLLERVGLDPETRSRYPHELSGGQKQRAALARALTLDPDLLVLDEPVSALDVSVQAEIMHLLDDLQRDYGLSMLLITHDMGVVRTICDRVAVMYLGEIVERGPVEDVFGDPQHPYTRALVASVPTPDPEAPARDVELCGEVPDAANPPGGCRFHTRCPEVIPPERFSFEDDEWRRVMDLRVALERDGFDRSVLEASDESDIAAAVREEFDVPVQLSHADAEAVLSRALSKLVDGDSDAATELLAEEFETICESERPTLDQTGAGHEAACHLHETAENEPAK
ncbi:ABC transporter ATP-binding protein [Halorussus salinisoli]|uniref:ABC transporter ATP-binding protein n=1 Tax=Halorussus salinisoli TaxID=2558242 RepID=UPI0010C15D6F|nr:ABC transporter ATP-binding protein [Halorussus salinisoli]